MKKIVLLTLIFCAGVGALFAGDANVLPGRVGRLYVVPAYSFWGSEFDEDGSREDFEYGNAQTVNLAAALEYGITDYLSFGIRYIPGYVLYNDFTKELGKNIDATGSSSIDIGLKFQLIGENAPIKTDRIQLSFLPGLIVPTMPYDAEDEYADFLAARQGNDNEFAPDGVSPNSLAGGMQTAFDYFFTPNFMVNLYNEFRLHGAECFECAGIAPYATWKMAVDGGLPLPQPGKIYPGADLTFEIEPTYTTYIVPGLEFTGSLAAIYKYNPGQRFVDDYAPDTSGLPLAVQPMAEGAVQGINNALDDESHLVALGPSVAFFFQQWPIPMEFQIDSTIPLWGKNVEARNTVLFQWEVYFRF